LTQNNLPPTTAPPTTCLFFSFNTPPPTQIYTLSLHDALPISPRRAHRRRVLRPSLAAPRRRASRRAGSPRHRLHDERSVCHRQRSEEHTSELQSRGHLVCRLLLEKKKKKTCVMSARRLQSR